MNKKIVHAVYIIAAAAVLGMPGPSNDALAQLGLPQVPGGLRDLSTDIDRRARTRAERAAEEASKEASEAAAKTAAAVDDTVDETVDDTAATLADAGREITATVANASRVFVPGVDPNGADIEADVVVALVDAIERQELLDKGFMIISERELAGLGRTMLTLRRPAAVTIFTAVQDLRQQYPGAVIDYNHVYRFDEAVPIADTPAKQQLGSSDASADGPPRNDARLHIGIIDSAVFAAHRDFSDVTIISQDFVAVDGERPKTHGTAVASLAVRSARKNIAVYSASVFFESPGHAPGASTEGLVTALDWLAGQGVDVINMSLSGPENALLQAAINAALQRGNVIVAAVGNNGPNGDPMYPGAYDGVIGVTAVDRDRRVYRNANRGKHVDYAALGVNVKIADSETGGWRIASGTSMASPHIAVVAAQILREDGMEAEALMSWLTASAEDLGRKGFDPVYGHGLITQPPVVVSDN